MPSIAQQDYFVINVRDIGYDVFDAMALAQISKAVKQGIIYDVVLKAGRFTTRVAAHDSLNGYVFLYSSGAGEIISVDAHLTPTQYEGLAAIQVAENNFAAIPAMTTGNEFELVDDNGTCYILCDGKCLIVENDDKGRIAAIKKSELDPPQGEETVEISFEDAQKLIGIRLI